MTIDEAITRYKNNAEYERTHGNLQGCLEFRQLVDWLKDYKRLKEQKPILDKIRAEIEQSRYGLASDGLDLALNIIDKYKAESEEV